VASLAHSPRQNSTNFLVDSGAGEHWVADPTYLHDPTPVTLHRVTADNTPVSAHKKGHLIVTTKEGVEIQIENVYWSPSITQNLLAATPLMRAFGDISRKANTIILGGRVQIKIAQSGHWELEATIQKQNHISSLMSWDKFHNDWGHLSENRLISLKEQLGIRLEGELHQCETCHVASRKDSPHKSTIPPGDAPLERIYIDTTGPYNSHTEYAMVITDGYSRMSWVYILPTKSADSVLEALETWYTRVVASYPRPNTITVRSDGGREYQNQKVTEFFREQMMKRELTTPSSPQSNAIVEATIREGLVGARKLLIASQVHWCYWPYALRHAILLRNITSLTVGSSSPFEIFYGAPFQGFNKILPFGAKVSWAATGPKTKLDPRGEIGTYLGVSPFHTSDAGLVLTASNHISAHRGLRVLGEDGLEQLGKLPTTYPIGLRLTKHFDGAPFEGMITDYFPEEDWYRVTYSDGDSEDLTPKEISDLIHLSSINNISTPRDDTIPASITEALTSATWKEATIKEISSLQANSVFKVVPKPSPVPRAISTKMLFTTKRDGQKKARFVARGFSQVKFTDYEATYSPTVSKAAIYTFLSIATTMDMHIAQLDVTTAYLNAEMDMPNRVQLETMMLDALDLHPADNEIVILHKALYGTKQGGRQWHLHFKGIVESIGWKSSRFETNFFKRGMSIMVVFVDDILVATPSPTELNEIVQELSNHFSIKNLGFPEDFIGLQLTKGNSEIVVTQDKYTANILQEFDLGQKTYPTPVGDVTVPSEEIRKEHRFASIAGALNYLAHWTRPDITYAVSTMCSGMHNPTQEHWAMAKRILGYLKEYPNLRLTFQKSSITLRVYVDASYADLPGRKSTTGVIVLLGENIVDFTSQRQPIVADSSTAAEYVALGCATKITLWLQHLLSFLGFVQPTTRIYEDNMGAILVARGDGPSKRTKHLDIRHHFIQEHVALKDIEIIHVPTDMQLADILTKGLSENAHHRLLSRLIRY